MKFTIFGSGMPPLANFLEVFLQDIDVESCFEDQKLVRMVIPLIWVHIYNNTFTFGRFEFYSSL